MKKVLIITYYWPPSGGSGVQRWLKFTKYLPEFGWEPIIYTPENPEYPSIDHSFEKDIPSDITVLKTPIWEPYNFYRKLTGKKGQPISAGFISENKKQGWKDKLSIWIRGNFLIPDPRRFWIKPSVQFLTEYLKTHPIDAVVTTGPPHSMHMIGLGLKKNLPMIPWIADFRDPWTNIDFYKDLNLSRISDTIHRKKEKQVLTHANKVVSVTPTWCRELSENAARDVDLVHNGYDEDDIVRTNISIDTDFSIVHIGSVNVARNPKILWKALGELIQENKELKKYLKIKFVGNVESVVYADIEQYGLSPYLEKLGYLSHAEAISFQQTSQLLLLLINKTPNANGILTGKLYEYMASNRPILAIGPIKSDIANLLHETNGGLIVDFDDMVGMKLAVLEFFDKYRTGKLHSAAYNYRQYSRKAQCNIIANLLEQISDIK